MTARRRIAAAIAIAASASLAGAGAEASTRAPAHRLLVYAEEWHLYPSRTTIPAGTVLVELSNRGQDPHDVRIRRFVHGRMSGPAQGVKPVPSGGLGTAVWHLRAGRYELFCSMPGHLQMGMHAGLTVTRA